MAKLKHLKQLPKTFASSNQTLKHLQGSTPQENAATLFKILSGKTCENDPKSEIVLANSAAAIIVAGKAPDFKCGMDISRESLRSGAAYKKLRALIKVSEGDLSKLEEFEQKYD